MELCRKNTKEQLTAYLTDRHVLLVDLLPSDTTCVDLFVEVDAKWPITAARSNRKIIHINAQAPSFSRSTPP